MKVLFIIFVSVGLAFLVIAATSRFMVGMPFSLLGVRALSLIGLANTAFLLAVLIKVSEKK